MARERKIVIAYDISRHKTRRMVHKILKSWPIDGQKSVHECWLEQMQAQELFIQLEQDIDAKTDSLMMAWLEPRRAVLYRGIGKETGGKGLVHLGAGD
ncbi:MAG: CRISPR-associated endonuclease Cas2 [Desulfobacterales bacterium]